MKKILAVLLMTGLISGCATPSIQTEKEPDMITHSVFLKLKHAAGSEAETAFLEKAAALAAIPGVGSFQTLEETSPKNEFTFGLSMVFADQAAYDGYNTHPDHVAFVQNIWLKEVESFQEIDYIVHTK